MTTKLHPTDPVLEALDDGVCLLDAAWRVTYWNAAAARMVGKPREAVLGRLLWEVLPALYRSPSCAELQRVARERVPCRFLQAHPEGPGRGYASVHAAPLADGGLVLHFRDATEEVAGAERYATLLESIRDGFIAVDPDWKIRYLNGVAESLLRFPRDQAVGVSLWSLLPRGPEEIAQCLRATMTDGIQRHLRDVRPEGRVFRGRIFDLWSYPLAGGGVSLLFEDVSERAQREQELARFAAEAEAANEAKSRFFAAISHELRTPLNAIVGYTHLLSTEAYGSLPEGARRAAERSGICAEHLSRLVDDVLLLTTAEIRRIPVTPSPVCLQEHLPAVVEPLRHQAVAKGLDFQLVVPAELPPVETDAQRLRQVLVALLSNAVKFTSRGAVRLEVVLRPGSGFDPESAGYDLFADPQLEFLVTDTGPGIAPHDRERIFGPFEQLGDPSRSQSMAQGTGLGLTIARQLAQLLHGTLYLAESSGAGSSFSLRIPLAFSARSTP